MMVSTRQAVSRSAGILIGAATGVLAARGDGILHSYEATVAPYDASAGWVIADACQPPCAESLENGHFVLRWTAGGNFANFDRTIAAMPTPPPPSLWVEWRFRSNHPLGPSFYDCDAGFTVDFRTMHELVFMYGDAVITQSGDDVVHFSAGDFHTFRFESPDGVAFSFAVDGAVFRSGVGDFDNGFSYLQFFGKGGCAADQIANATNEWDYVRYGTMGTGERVFSIDPPAGYLDPQQYAGLDRFAVTFDQPNYLYINDIAVEVTGGGTPPVVTKTWRRENDGPQTLEIVLDRPIPLGETTRFTFTDGSTNNVVEYTLAPSPPEPIPTVSEWGLAILAILLLVAGHLARFGKPAAVTTKAA